MHGSGRRNSRRGPSPVATGFASVALVVMTTAGGVGLTVWRNQQGEQPVLLRAEPTPTTVAATTTTTAPPPTTTIPATTTTAAAPVTTTTAINLPIPDALPEDPYAPTPEVVLGTLAIPKLGVEQQLVQGMTLTAINLGPSHWAGTALPGQLGNMVIAGHRTTYTRPFRDIDQLVPGDQMVITTADGVVHTYAVTGTEVVTPDQTSIADQTWAYTATLFACHPPGSAAYRIVAHLQLVDAAGRPVAPPPPPTAPVAPAGTTAPVPGAPISTIPALGGS